MAEEKIILEVKENKSTETTTKLNSFLPKSTAAFGSMIAKLTKIGASVYLLKESSQAFKGTYEILKRAFQLVLKPLGDFIGMLLRPLAVLLLRWVRNLLKNPTKEEIKTQTEEGFSKLGSGDVGTTIEGLTDIINSWVDNALSGIKGDDIATKFIKILLEFVLKLPGLIAQGLWVLFKAAWDIGYAIGTMLADYIIIPLQEQFKKYIEKVVELWSEVVGFMADVWKEVFSFLQTYLIDPILNFWKKIWSYITDIKKNVLDWIKEYIKTPITDFFGKIKTGIENIWDSISKWLEEYITNPIKSFFNKIKDWVSNLWNKISGNSTKEKESQSVSDAIIAPGGKVITTDPQDYLIATKDPSSLIGSGSKISNLNITISIEKIDSEARIRELAEKISSEIQRKTSYMVGG